MQRPRRRRLSYELLERRRVLASILVTTHQDIVDADDGETSLREAITQANSTPDEADVISFAPGTNGFPLSQIWTDGDGGDNTNEKGDFDFLSGRVTLVGNGMGQTIIDFQSNSLSGPDTGEGIFDLLEAAKVTFQDLTIQNGRATAERGFGGAIAARTDASGSLRLERVRLTGNQAGRDGGAVFGLGTSKITIIDSIIDNNSARGGGGIATSGELTVLGTSFNNNSAAVSGGAMWVQDTVTPAFVESSTFFGNESGAVGGAISNFRSNLDILNTTLSGNVSGIRGGAILTLASLSTTAETNVLYSTITDNTTLEPGMGVLHTQSETDGASAVTTLQNSILVGNNGVSSSNISFADSGSVPDVIVTSRGGNVFDDDASQMGGEFDRLSVSQPVIRPDLVDNGGPVATHGLVANSPAIGQAVPVTQRPGAQAPDADARGVTRGTETDAGAFAVQSPRVVIGFNRDSAEEGGVHAVFIHATATALSDNDLLATGNIQLSGITVEGEGIDGTDVTLPATMLTIDVSTASEASARAVLAISIVDDALVESPHEVASVNFNTVNGIPRANVSLQGGELTILDNDRAEVTLRDVTVSDSDDTATIPITLSNPVDVAVEIILRTLDGTARAGVDFIGQSELAVTIPAGETSRVATIAIEPDSSVEGDRAFRVEIDRLNAGDARVQSTSRQLDQPAASLTDTLSNALVTPDGRFVLYLADTERDESYNLIRVPVDGGPALQLNESLVVGGIVAAFRVTSDGNRVVYRADQDTDNVFELYSVSIAGGTPTKLNPTLIDGGDVLSQELSPDGSRVVYRADQDTNGVTELYSVPIDGGTPTKLNASLVSGGGVVDFKISPDSSRVIYRADQDVNDVVELYSVPITGGTPTRLNGDLTDAGDIFGYQLSHDANWVVYRGDQDTNSVIELYSVPVTGGTPIKLSSDLVDGGDIFGIVLGADSSRVVYRADQDTDEVAELYSVPITGGTPTKLNASLVSGGDVESSIKISPDGSQVLYRGDQDREGFLELYSVPIAGGTPVKLNDNLVNGGDVFGYQISADSSRVVYRADQDIDDVVELYSVPINGGRVTPLSTSPVDGGDVFSIHLTPDSRQVVFRGDMDTNDVSEIYRVPITGGMITKLNPDFAKISDVDTFRLSPDGSHLVYRSDQDSNGVQELFSVSMAGETPIKLNGDLVAGGGVFDFQLSTDGDRVVYRADQNRLGVTELYSVPIDGGASTKLNSNVVFGGNVAEFELSSDGGRVVYRADQDTNNRFELYSVPIHGGTPVTLNTDLVSEGDVSRFRVTADGSHVVYLADQERDERLELYSVPISGGTPTRLNAGLVSGGRVHDFQLSPDGSRVVYLADQDVSGTRDLFSVPIGGGTPVKLNPDLVGDGDVARFVLSSDGSRVVYFADQEQDEVVELYAVPITGGSAIKLNAALVLGGDVLDAQLSPDGSRVIYRADQDTDDSVELYTVSVDGGTFTKLNGNLVSGGDVLRFLLSPDGSQLVYLADQDTNEVAELYRVPVNGGTPTKLNDSLAGGANVVHFGLSPDGSRVLFAADQDQIGDVNLYSVPIAGGTPWQLNRGKEPEDSEGNAVGFRPVFASPDEVVFLEAIDNVTRLSLTPTVIDATVTITDVEAPFLDFGDAPPHYPVSSADDGARHVVGSLFLGGEVDAEYDGTNSPAADDDGRDEDGVAFLATLIGLAGSFTTSSILVEASQAGRLDGFLDLNGDADWDDPGEKILDSVAVIAGTQTIPFTIPTAMTSGQTAARFRLSTEGNLGPTGAALDGEVEDVIATIVDGSASASVTLSSRGNGSTLRFGRTNIQLDSNGVTQFRAPARSVGTVEYVPPTDPESLRIALPNGELIDGSRLFFRSFAQGSSVVVDGQGSTIDLTNESTFAGDASVRLDLSDRDETQAIIDSVLVDKWSSADDAMQVILGEGDRLQFRDQERWRMGSPISTEDGFRSTAMTVEGSTNVTLVIQTPTPWRNAIDPFDVTNDGQVSGMDTLRIINALNRSGDSSLAMPTPGESLSFYDVNGDNEISAIDALQIINELNRRGGSEAQGEPLGASTAPPRSREEAQRDTQQVSEPEFVIASAKKIACAIIQAASESEADMAPGHEWKPAPVDEVFRSLETGFLA
ncbi:MAG: GEVED domain-containing protein [Planctomycetota bacterium]